VSPRPADRAEPLAPGGGSAARVQRPNPIDLMFFAADQAQRRCGLPGANIQSVLELGGTLNVDRLRAALGLIVRRYPVLGARPCVSLWTGRPYWCLDRPVPPGVHVRHVSPATDDALRQAGEDVFAVPVARWPQPPVEFTVLRAAGRGDHLVMRFPHALMDARGAMTVLDELDRLDMERPAAADLATVGDERRRDYAAQFDGLTLGERLGLLGGGPLPLPAAPGGGGLFQLAGDPIPRDLGRVRYTVRALSAADLQRAQDNALRACGPARFGDFLRACGLIALHRLCGRSVSPGTLYSTYNLLDIRPRRANPVCWNLTSSLPLAIPARLAVDRRTVADLLREQMLGHLAARTALRSFARLTLLMQPPTAAVAAVIHAGWQPGRRPRPQHGAAPTPSLPLGLIGRFARPMRTFCGVPLVSSHGFRTPLPDTGFALDANMTDTGMNITGAWLEARVDGAMVGALLDELVGVLLE
jgi:hypothetical protein